MPQIQRQRISSSAKINEMERPLSQRVLDCLLGTGRPIYITLMSKIEILEELPKLTKTERQEIRLKLAELDGEDWFDEEEPLTADEKALLDARLAAYAKDPDAGGSWEEVEGRIRARFSRYPTREPLTNRQTRSCVS